MGSNSLPSPEQVDHHATTAARTFAAAATAPPAQSGGFVPPRLDQLEGPPAQAGRFVPPRLDQLEEPDQQAKSFADEHGVKNPVAASALDFVQGVGSGALNLVYQGGDLIRRLTGSKRIINTPEVQGLIKAPESMSGKAGRFAEQAAEFALPMGATSKATKAMSLLPRIGAEAATSGAVGALQSGGDLGATAGATAAGAAGPVLGAGIGALGRSKLPQKIYQSALKPTWAMAKNDGLQMLDTGIREQIPVSAAGLSKVERIIDQTRAEISKGIQAHAASGKTVDTAKVLASLDDLENFYRSTAAPEAALKTIQGIKLEFEQYHGQRIPLDRAQQIKINTYQELKKSYGEMASAKVEGLKQVARGLKEQISAVFPEIANLNERQSKLLGLDDALYRAVWRIENHQLMGIGSPLAATAGRAVMGGPGATMGLFGKLLLDDPTVKSRLAISLAKAGVRNPSAAISTRIAVLKGMMRNATAENFSGPEQPTGSLAPQPAQ